MSRFLVLGWQDTGSSPTVFRDYAYTTSAAPVAGRRTRLTDPREIQTNYTLNARGVAGAFAE